MLDAEEVSAFHTDGFVRVERLIPDDVVAPLHDACAACTRASFPPARVWACSLSQKSQSTRQQQE